MRRRGYIVFSITKVKMVFKEHWKRYSIAIGALLIVNIVEVIPPKVLGVTIDNIKQERYQTKLLYSLFLF